MLALCKKSSAELHPLFRSNTALGIAASGSFSKPWRRPPTGKKNHFLGKSLTHNNQEKNCVRSNALVALEKRETSAVRDSDTEQGVNTWNNKNYVAQRKKKIERSGQKFRFLPPQPALVRAQPSFSKGSVGGGLVVFVWRTEDCGGWMESWG